MSRPKPFANLGAYGVSILGLAALVPATRRMLPARYVVPLRRRGGERV